MQKVEWLQFFSYAESRMTVWIVVLILQSYNFQSCRLCKDLKLSKQKNYGSPIANIYLLKVNKRNTRKRCEICDDDGDDDDDDDELFLWYRWPSKGVYVLFPDETIVRDPHHRESATRRE